MAEAKQVTFSFKELATLLVKQQGIHEGQWGLFVRFGLQGANVGTAPGSAELFPAAIVPIVELGIQRFDEANPLSVDASEVNPRPAEKRNKSSK